MRISESFKLITVVEPKDYGSAGIVGDSVNMALLHRICFPVAFGALTGNSILSFYTGASQGTKTTQIAFKYRLSSGDYKAASADLYAAEVSQAATGLTLTATTYDNRAVLVEIEGEQMTDAEPWLTLDITSTATVMNVACVAVGVPRFQANVQPTAI